MAPLSDYLAALDRDNLPETLIDDILAEAANDAAPAVSQIEELTANLDAANNALIESDANANTLTAQLKDVTDTLTAVQAHNYRLMTTGGDVAPETIIGEGDNVDDEPLTGDPVLDVFFTEIDK